MRTSSIMLWIALLAPAAAWAADLQLRYALIQWACANHKAWLLTSFSIPLLLIALAGAAVGWRYSGSDHARIKFMALSALALGIMFGLAIVATTLPDFFLAPCE